MSNLSNAQRFSFKPSNTKRRAPFDAQPGDTFGEWTVICREPDYMYRVQCTCGIVATISGARLRNKLSTMCPICSIKERRKQRHKKEGMLYNGKLY